MTRDELIARTRQLVEEGERLGASPSMAALQTWLQLSDDLLSGAWGAMDRYHLSWLMVGRPTSSAAGRSPRWRRRPTCARSPRRRPPPCGRAWTPWSGSGCRSVARPAGSAQGRGWARSRRLRDPTNLPDIPMPARARRARSRSIPGWPAGWRTHDARPASTASTSAALRVRTGSSGDRRSAHDHGRRRDPAGAHPDPIARDYLLLVLRLDQHRPGIVDGYFGPADLKARVDLVPLPAPTCLADDAAALRERVGREVPEADRRHWLDLQLVALETLAHVASGTELAYLDEIERCFAWRPERRSEAALAAAAAELDDLLPGDAPLEERLRTEDDLWTVAPDAARVIVDRLVARFRARSAELFGLPEGEDLRVSFVRDQPWSGYEWYDGGGRSRVDLNTDLPLRIPALIGTVAHETYPGHHLEHASKERRLVDELGRLEASVLAIDTPECLVSEGLANLGREFVVPRADEAELIIELAHIGGLPLAGDPARLRAATERAIRVTAVRKVLDTARVNAALLRHADGRSHAEVLTYLIEVGRLAPETAAKRLEFIEHPLWRTYVFVYPDGEALVRRWVDAVPPADRVDRFARLLREPITPVSIAADLSQAGAAGAAGAAGVAGATPAPA